MRRFLMFLVVTIIAVSLGLTVYAFIKDDEVISINTTPIYLNVGQTLSLNDIDFEHIKAKDGTVIDFNAGSQTVRDHIEYNVDTKVFTAKVGGSVTLLITSSHKKYNNFQIEVTIGDGSSETPFYIENETDMAQYLYTEANLYKNFLLLNDIDLQNTNLSPIGYTLSGSNYVNSGFSGVFDGNNKTIYNASYSNETSFSQVGLFSKLNVNSEVKNLKLINTTVNGSYEYAGALAGLSNGTIDKCIVENGTVINDHANAVSGLIVGKLAITTENTNAKLTRSYATGSVTSKNILGGLVGHVDKALVQACWTNGTVTLASASGSNNNVGGLIGLMTAANNAGSIRECYSMATVNLSNTEFTVQKGILLGKIVGNNGKQTVMGLYYSDDTVTNESTAIGNCDASIFTIPYGVNNETVANLKNKDTYIFYQLNNADDNADTENWNFDTCWFIQPFSAPEIMFTTKVIPAIKESINLEYTTIKTITTKEQLLSEIATADADTLLVLKNDIDFGGEALTPLDNFSSNLRADTTDDGYYGIRNFTITTNHTNVGFFASIENANIFNIEFSQINVTGNGENVGAIAGLCKNSKIQNVNIFDINCNLNTNATTINVGGAFGTVIDSSISGISMVDIKVDNRNDNSVTNLAHRSGGFAGNTSFSQISSCTMSGIELKGYALLGGLTGKTSSCIIDNVTIDIGGMTETGRFTEIHAYGKGSEVYVGGLVGFNNGDIKNSEVSTSILVSSSEQKRLCVGGIAGYNLGNITNTSTNETIDNIVVEGEKGTAYVGGIVGYNYSSSLNELATINKCNNKIDLRGQIVPQSTYTSIELASYVGGLAGFNSGLISNGYNIANITGLYAGGLVAKNLANVRLCYSSGISPNADTAYKPDSLTRNDIKGAFVGGLVAQMTSGVVEDCFVASNLMGWSNTSLLIVNINVMMNGSLKGGLVSSFRGSEQNYGIIKNCVSACSFDTVGENLIAGERDLMYSSLSKKAERITGTITNCILDYTVGSNANKQSEGISILGINTGIKGYTLSKSSFKVVSTAEMLLRDNYSTFNSSWSLTNLTKYPVLNFES